MRFSGFADCEIVQKEAGGRCSIRGALREGKMVYDYIEIKGLRVGDRVIDFTARRGWEGWEVEGNVGFTSEVIESLCHVGMWGNPQGFGEELTSALGEGGKDLLLRNKTEFYFTVKEEGEEPIRIKGTMENGEFVEKFVKVEAPYGEGEEEECSYRMGLKGIFEWDGKKWDDGGRVDFTLELGFSDARLRVGKGVRPDSEAVIEEIFEGVFRQDEKKVAKAYKELMRTPMHATGERFFGYLSVGEFTNPEKEVWTRKRGGEYKWEINLGGGKKASEDSERTAEELWSLMEKAAREKSYASVLEILDYCERSLGGKRVMRR